MAYFYGGRKRGSIKIIGSHGPSFILIRQKKKIGVLGFSKFQLDNASKIWANILILTGRDLLEE